MRNFIVSRTQFGFFYCAKELYQIYALRRTLNFCVLKNVSTRNEELCNVNKL
jgi:hypothetical protein